MKKILLAVAILVLPALLLAAEAGLTKEDRAYMDIKALVDSGASTMPMTKESLTRAEAVAYVENAVSVTAQAGFSASKDDLERLYSLVKSFQTDMMDKGYKLGDIEDTLSSIKVREAALEIGRIEEKENNILDTFGFKINGDAATYMTDLLLYGNKYANNDARYRPITQVLDLKFSVKPDRTLYAEAVFRLEALAGGSWGQDNLYGVRNFLVRGDYGYPLTFTLGDYHAKLTPFTLWAVDDDRPFESKIFSDKRDMNKKELDIRDNSWPLTGGTASTRIKIAGDFAFDATAMAARVAAAGGTYTTTYSGYITAINYLTYTADNFVYPHDRYMAAGRVSSDFTLKDMLNIGGNFIEIKDAEDTGIDHGSPVLDNYVSSVDAELKLFGIIRLKGEFAVSNYYVGTAVSTQAWNNSYISDSAIKAVLEAEYYNTKFEGTFSVVGNSFTAYAAQSRIYDGYDNYDYLTQNNTWNVSTVPAGYSLYNLKYPLTRYNPSIIADYLAVGRNLMPYVFYENNAQPYGDSTPNRQGFSGKLSGDYLDGFIAPSFKYTYLTEIVSYLPGSQFTCPREFKVAEAGVKISLGDLKLTGGYKNEITDNTYTGGGAHLESSVIDAGASYTFFKKLGINIGLKNDAFKGTEYPYTYSGTSWGYQAKANYDTNILSYGASASYELLKNASLGLSFTKTAVENKLAESTNYGAQEIDARVNIVF
jgi:hypothetical protein